MPSASLSGIVLDQSDAAVPLAVVQLKNRDNGRSWKLASAADGTFQFIEVPPGRYQLLVTMKGFISADYRLELTLDERRDVPVRLALENGTASIVVVPRDITAIDRAKPSLGRTITRHELDELPVITGLSQDFTALALLAPGILPDPSGSGIAAAGQNGNNNSFYLDGLSGDSAIAGSTVIVLPLGAIQEFRTVTNHFGAEVGQASGAVVSVVSRAGGNVPTGRAYVLLQDGAWNAASPIALQNGAQDSGAQTEMSGGLWGGPLVRNRAFLFAAAEHVNKTKTYVTSPIVLTFDPNATLSWPTTIKPSRLFSRSDIDIGDSDVLTLRGSVFVTTAKDSEASRETEKTWTAFQRGRSLDNRFRNLAILETHVLGSTASNEFRMQWSHSHFTTSVDAFCPDCAALNYPRVLFGKPINAPQSQLGDRLEGVDVVTWTPSHASAHMVRAGVDVTGVEQSGVNPNNTSGTYTFQWDVPFNDSVLESYPTTFTQNLGNPNYRVRERIVSLFAQDDWRIHRRTAASVGVRWDHTDWPVPSQVRDDVAPRLGLAVDVGSPGIVVARAAAGRYFDESQLAIARDGQTGFLQLTINGPGFQGSAAHFDPYAPTLVRSGPPKPRLSFVGSTDLQTPYSDQASVGIQVQAGRHMTASADVVRALGHRLVVGRKTSASDQLSRAPFDVTVDSVIFTETRAQSWYTGFLTAVRHQVSAASEYAVSYTWSTSENDTDGRPPAFPSDKSSDPPNLLLDRGPTLNDARHQLVVSGSTQLPWRWRMSSLLTARSALPFNVTKTVSSNERAEGVSRNSGRGSTYLSLDVRFSRTIRVWSKQIEVLLDAFNVTNHANLSNYVSNDGTPTNASPTSADPARQLQLGIRFNF